jgi:hypothetical protein
MREENNPRIGGRMWVMVLDDGQTFSVVDGCSVLYVPTSVDDIDGFVKENVKEKGYNIGMIERYDTPSIGDLFVPRQDYEE